MIRCAVPRGSKTTKRLPSHALRSKSSNAAPRGPPIWGKPTTLEDLERSFGISDPSSTPTAQSIKHYEWVKEKELKERVLGDPYLPISPYMDDEYLAAKEQYKKPKNPPAQGSQRTPFQVALAKNPYALALATPIRMCNVTGTVLPRYFLQDFNLMKHPKNGEPWWVPRSLAGPRNGPMRDTSVGDLPYGPRRSTLNESGQEENAEDAQMEGQVQGERLASSPGIGPSSYTLARQELISSIASGSYFGRGKDIAGAFGSRRHNVAKPMEKVIKKSQLRKDAASFMLMLMRRRVVEGLQYLFHLKPYIRAAKSWEDALQASRQVGALLYTGPPSQYLTRNSPPSSLPTHAEPTEFATLLIGTTKPHKVPVYNLRTLLGEDTEFLERLRKDCPVFENEILVLRHKNVTVDLQLKLWKLQGFIARFEEWVGMMERR